MGQAKPFRATALVVEDDPMQREMICLLLEESHFDVIECESAEAAALVLQRIAGKIALVMTDVSLAGTMDGVTLAIVAKRCDPTLDVIVTSGSPPPRPLPQGVAILVKTLGAARRHPHGRAEVSSAVAATLRCSAERRGAAVTDASVARRPILVMAGLVPAIHVFGAAAGRRGCPGLGMTETGAPHAASASPAGMLLPAHDAVLPADHADRGRLARHRRALYAGGGAGAGLARPRRRRVRLHARHRAADDRPRCWGSPPSCTPARSPLPR